MAAKGLRKLVDLRDKEQANLLGMQLRQRGVSAEVHFYWGHDDTGFFRLFVPTQDLCFSRSFVDALASMGSSA